MCFGSPEKKNLQKKNHGIKILLAILSGKVLSIHLYGDLSLCREQILHLFDLQDLSVILKKNSMLDFIPRKVGKHFQLEKDFQRWFREQIENHFGIGHPYHKMSDMDIQKKPCDCFLVDDIGRALFCELKIIPGLSLNLNKYEYQQVEFLTKVSSRGQVHSLALSPVYSQKFQTWYLYDWEKLMPRLFAENSIKIFLPDGSPVQELLIP